MSGGVQLTLRRDGSPVVAAIGAIAAGYANLSHETWKKL